ncbi:EF-hand domain-containing protein [Paucibacter sp. DJ1R-11]|uniref:EF-hand domain-containing protein n=1 Tax=Paucibacter sp. DJ1R-11 TaxID=2893556 RepID=UPI0021E44BAF|nr:EF-hand domain-containing protein [Paucibacter sp. DJ1R-11]MCV2365176.1 EF-hand domain-containing protein [Paucibacter sp. DJ1R-11]
MIASAMSIASSSTASTRAVAPPRPPKAEDVFKQIDAEGKGSVTAADAAAYLVKISPEGARKADAAASARLQQDIAQSLSQADVDGNGQLSQSEFKQALSQGPAGARPADGDGDDAKDAAAAAGRSPAGGRAQGPPPGGHGGPGAAKPAAASASSGTSSSSSSSSFEKEDANRDGKVTEPERQAYAAQHPTQGAHEARAQQNTAAVAASVRAASELALQRYQEVASSLG